MTLEDIEALPRDILTAEDVAPYLECDPHNLRLQARENLDSLGFPASVIGTRLKIYKPGFISYVKYGRPILLGANLEGAKTNGES